MAESTETQGVIPQVLVSDLFITGY